MLKLQCITVDARNPKALAEFWAEALGWKIGEDVNELEVWIERELGDPNNTGFPDILFLKTLIQKLERIGCIWIFVLKIKPQKLPDLKSWEQNRLILDNLQNPHVPG